MNYAEISKLLEEYEYNFTMAQVVQMPDGTKQVKSLPHLVQAAIIQLKLSKLFTGIEAETHVRLAASFIAIIKEEMKRLKPEAFQEYEKKKEKEKAVSNSSGKDENKAGENDEADGWVLESAPDVTFDDIMGLEEVKKKILESLSWQTEKKHLLEKVKLEMNNRFLLYGPPGTGKTMIAKAIANYMMDKNAKFFTVGCSELVSKYVGESEKNIKALFEKAAEYDRAVIFLDEFESLCPKRNEGDNQVNNRIVATLLTHTDGIGGKGKNIMLIMATNYPWRIDSAMLSRTGNRFYIPLPDEPARRYTLEKKLSHLAKGQGVDISALAAETEGYNHRDLNNLCDAIKVSIMRRCDEAGILGAGDEPILPISMEDLEYARQTVRSSANPAEVREMENWVNAMV